MAGSDSIRRRRGQRWRDLSVGRKLFAGFAGIGLLLLASLGAQFAVMVQMARGADRIVAGAAATLRAAEDLRYAAADLRGTQTAYLIDRGASRGEYEASQRRFDDDLAAVRATGEAIGRSRLIAKISTGFETFTAIDQMVWDSLQAGEPDRARQLAVGPEGLDFANMAGDADALAASASADSRRLAARFAATYRTGRQLAAGSGVAAVVLVVGLSALLTRAIRRPLTRVQQAAERAAGGDLTAEARVTSLDETGRLARAFDSMLDNLRLREDHRLIESQRQELDSQLHRALDMADEEPAALGVVGRALGGVVPGRDSELLLTTPGGDVLARASVTAGGGAPGCPVASMGGCTAVRHGRTVRFPTSEALDACPKLAGRPAGPLSATCIPVTFMGGAVGVLHTTGAVGEALGEEQVLGLETLAARAGARIGMLRSIRVTEAQATTDPLTGLMNRRSFESTAKDLYRRGVPFALIMADLDHFKLLNDSAGHEAGDDSLRIFADVLRSTSRGEDAIARWGGEEFVALLPGCTGEEGIDAAQRIRLTLAATLNTPGSRLFTSSFGVAESSGYPSLQDVINAADVVLYQAKENGRDQAVLATPHPAGRHDTTRDRLSDLATP